MSGVLKLGIMPERRLCDGEKVAEGVGGFLTCSGEGPAMWHLGQQRGNVGRGDNLKELVGGVVLQSPHFGGGVEEADAGSAEEVDDGFFAVGLCHGVDEMQRVVIKDCAHNAPHIVVEIGVEEIDLPAFLLWREGAEHEDLPIRGKERL